MGEKHLGPRWGGDAGRSEASPHAGYTDSEASPWVAAGNGLTGKEGQYLSSLPRVKKSFHPFWATADLLAFSLCTWHLWISQIPLVGGGMRSENWKQVRADEGQVTVD